MRHKIAIFGALSAHIAQQLKSLDCEMVEQPQTEFVIQAFPRDEPAFALGRKTKDWQQPRQRNNYKSKRRRAR